MCNEAEQAKMAFFQLIITLKIIGVLRKKFSIHVFSLRSTTVLNFMKIQNIWCNPFAHLAWNDPLKT